MEAVNGLDDAVWLRVAVGCGLRLDLVGMQHLLKLDAVKFSPPPDVDDEVRSRLPAQTVLEHQCRQIRIAKRELRDLNPMRRCGDHGEGVEVRGSWRAYVRIWSNLVDRDLSP